MQWSQLKKGLEQQIMRLDRAERSEEMELKCDWWGKEGGGKVPEYRDV